MHTLYMIYDGNGKVTDFAIDNVSAAQNFISLDRGPLSYVQSIIDNLNAYIKKNGDLTVENGYLSEVRHGQFDETYGEIQDKYINNPNYTFHGNTQPTTQPTEPQPAESSEPVKSSEASSTATPASSAPASSVSTPTSTPSK